MQLDSLIIETRARTGWAAIDLGSVLGRRYWVRGVLLYLTLAIPVLLLTRLVTEYYLLPPIILWWFKPLFERPLLYFMSRELFNEPVGYWKTLARWKEWLWPSLGWVLTFRRLSFNRGMYAPISLLERPKSGEYGDRASILGSKFASESTWLTVVLYHFENFLAIALLVLLAIFFPDQIKFTVTLFNELQENSVYVDTAYLIMMAVVAPFYTAAGFMLYISRRVELEGWDIEICFRNWMAGYAAGSGQNSTRAAEVV